nr:uncharacterized protein LOC109753496 [Aegilops tauschii subsp. strangulata]
MENQRSAVGWRIHPPPPPHLPPPPPPSTQRHDDQKFGGSQEISLEGTAKNSGRAKWNHQMKAYLIELLRDHDVPKYRTVHAPQVEANSAQGNDLTVHAPQVEAIPISSQHVGQTLHEIPQVVHRNRRPSSSAPEVTSRKRAKKQKTTSIDDFHERYLKLRREEIDRYAAIEERKLKDPFSIKKCIKALERLEGLTMADTLKAADIFTANKENREVFLSFSSNELRLGWLTGKIRNT